MEKTTSKYDPLAVAKIRMFLEKEAAKARPRFYAIYADDLKIVERTSDPGQFDEIEEYTGYGMKELRIQIYSTSESSPHVVSEYVFTFGKEDERKTEPLAGLGEIQERINERVTIERERWDCEQVKKDLAAAKEKLTDAEDYIAKLHGKIREEQSKAKDGDTINGLASVLKEIAGYGKSSGKESLSGSEGEKKPEGEATFKKKESQEVGGLSENEKRYIQAGREMEERFNQEQLDKVLAIIRALAANPAHIKDVAELLGIQ